jgi:hypothetical protein
MCTLNVSKVHIKLLQQQRYNHGIESKSGYQPPVSDTQLNLKDILYLIKSDCVHITVSNNSSDMSDS